MATLILGVNAVGGRTNRVWQKHIYSNKSANGKNISRLRVRCNARTRRGCYCATVLLCKGHHLGERFFQPAVAPERTAAKGQTQSASMETKEAG